MRFICEQISRRGGMQRGIFFPSLKLCQVHESNSILVMFKLHMRVLSIKTLHVLGEYSWYFQFVQKICHLSHTVLYQSKPNFCVHLWCGFHHFPITNINVMELLVRSAVSRFNRKSKCNHFMINSISWITKPNLLIWKMCMLVRLFRD